MKKTVKVILIVVVIALVAFGLFIAQSFYGNPIGKALATRAAEEYVSTTYPNTDYEIMDVDYDFKSGDYAALVISPSSRDTVFRVHFSGWGKLRSDDYPYEVENKFTTYRRVDWDYRALVDAMLQAEYPPDYFTIAFGALGFDMSQEIQAFGVEDFTLPMSGLELDKNYDVRELGRQAGMLTFYASSEEISYPEAAKILLQLKANLDKHDIPFRTIDFVLEKPRKDGVASGEKSIDILYFPAEDIYPEGLEQRLEKAHQKTLDYFNKMDKEKQQEIDRAEQEDPTP